MTGIYKSSRESRNDSIYILNEVQYQEEISFIRRKAPRQADALEQLVAHPGINCNEFDKIVSRSIISALIKKGLIYIEKNQAGNRCTRI
jgi:hypothetical protein